MEKIAKKYGKLLYLSLGGGEPLLRDDIPEICETFRRFTGVRFITLTTNGLLPKKISKEVERALEKCPDVQFTVPLSIDGISKTHDWLRGVPGGFEKTLQTYNELVLLQEKHANISINANTVVTSYNQAEIEKILEFVKEKMPRVRNHSLCFARGSTKEEKAKTVPVERLRQIVEFEQNLKQNRIRKKGLVGRLFDALALTGNKIALNSAAGKPMNWTCFAGRKIIEINEVGEVFPCEILWEKIGSLRESNYDLQKVLQSKKAKKAIEKIKQTGCNCTFECAIANSLVYSYKKYPAVFKEMAKI